MTHTSDISQMLEKVCIIYQEYEEKVRHTGESFNVYSILGLESAENKTHSAFLKELLDPTGCHLMGSIFLKLFLQQMDLPSRLDPKTTTVTPEQPIGTRNDDLKEGGRVDIYLKDKSGQTICIENKINARDQNTQIERYVNHNREKNTVIYLNLDGHDATPTSKGELKAEEHYYVKSYEIDIVKWLTACQAKVKDKPPIHEGIGQYINLIKGLTNQLSDQMMNKEIRSIIKENYYASLLLAAQIDATERETAKEFFEEMIKHLKDKLDSGWSFDISTFESKWGGLTISHQDFPRSLYIKIQGNDQIWNTGSTIGLAGRSNDKNGKILEMCNELDYFAKDVKSDPWWYKYDLFLNWDNPKERCRIYNKEERAEILNTCLDNTLRLAEELKSKFDQS